MFEGQTLTRGIPYIERNVPRLKGPKGTVLNHLQIKKCKRVGAYCIRPHSKELAKNNKNKNTLKY